MKTLKLLVDKEFLGERLGLEKTEFVITDINNIDEGVELTIITDDNAKVNNQFVLSEYKGNNYNLMRQSINEEKGLIVKDDDGNIVAKFDSNGGGYIKGGLFNVNNYDWNSSLSSTMQELLNNEIMSAKDLISNTTVDNINKDITINVAITSDNKLNAEELATQLINKVKSYNKAFDGVSDKLF